MGIIKRQSIKTAFVSYFGVLIGMVNLLYLYPKFLEPEEIGLIRAMADLCLMVAPFAQLGIASVILRYYPYFYDDEQKKREFATIFLLLPLIGFGLLLAVFLLFNDLFVGIFEKESPLLIQYSMLLIPLAFFIIFHNVFEAYTRTLLQVVVPKFLRDVLIRLLTGLLVIGYTVLAFDLDLFIALYVVIFLIAFVVLVIFSQILSPLKLTLRFQAISLAQVKEILVYSIYVIFGSVGGAIVARIDIIMLTALVDLKATGVYTISMFMGNVIEIPRRAISQIAQPVISKALKDGDLDQIQRLYKKSALNQLIIGAFILIGLWASIDYLFDVMPKGDIYQEGKFVVLFIGLAKLFDMGMGLNNEILVMSKYYRYNIYLMVFFVGVAIVTNYFLIPVFGLTGAAAATFLSIIFYNIARFFIVFLTFKIHPFSWGTVKAILIAFATYALTLLIPPIVHPIVTIAVIATVVTVVFWLLVLVLRVSEDVNKLAFQILGKVKSFISGK